MRDRALFQDRSLPRLALGGTKFRYADQRRLSAITSLGFERNAAIFNQKIVPGLVTASGLYDGEGLFDLFESFFNQSLEINALWRHFRIDGMMDVYKGPKSDEEVICK